MTVELPTTRAYRVAPPRSRYEPLRKTGWRAVAAIVFALDVGLAAWLWVTDSQKWPVGVAFVVIPLLLLVTTPLFVWAARSERRFDLAGLLATGLLLRFAASFYRFGNAIDADVYHVFGSNLAQQFRHLTFDVDTGSSVLGTGGMRYITGLVEVVTNANKFATFLVFTWLGFVGCVLLYRAFINALPSADHRRYALLIFLWPTLLFWPSSIGKDCWLLFTLGIGALGVARVITRRPGGYTLLVIGLLAGSVVRPHVALLELVAFGLALIVGRQSTRGGAVTPSSIGKVAGLIVLLVVGAVLADRFGSLVGSRDLTDIDAVLELSETRTSLGGSQFAPADPTNPIGYGQSVVTVLFRPFPSETGGLEQTAAALEAFFLLCLTIASWRRLVTIPRRLRDEAYVMFSLCYVAMFIFGFGAIANFGILARQRSQVMPFVFVVLSITVMERHNRVRALPGTPRSTRRSGGTSTSRAISS